MYYPGVSDRLSDVSEYSFGILHKLEQNNSSYNLFLLPKTSHCAAGQVELE